MGKNTSIVPRKALHVNVKGTMKIRKKTENSNRNFRFKTCEDPKAFFTTTIFKKRGGKSSQSEGQERYIMKTHYPNWCWEKYNDKGAKGKA